MTLGGKTVIIDTGNVFNLGLVQRKVLQNPNEEVLQGIENIFNCHDQAENNDNLQVIKFDHNQSEATFLSSGQNALQGFERNKLKLSVKLFLFPESSENSEEIKQSIIDESIESICKMLGVSRIDSLILSVQTNELDKVVPNLKSFWSACEKHISLDSNKVRSLGTSDLNVDQLSELYNWAVQVKPSSSQINLDACCDIPPELSAFTKDNSIQLLTHNDPTYEFLPLDRLQTLSKSLREGTKVYNKVVPSNSNRLQRKWIARYTFVLSGQGVLLSKGYLVSLLCT